MGILSSPVSSDFTNRPDNPSDWATTGPPNFIDDVASSYNYAIAGGAYAYSANVAKLYNDTIKKVTQAGGRLDPALDVLAQDSTEGRVAGTDFQSIVNEQADVPGIDYRYPEENNFKRQIRIAYLNNQKIIAEAQAKRPDLHIMNFDEINQTALSQIREARTLDPRMGWLSRFAAGLITTPATIAGGLIGNTDPVAPLSAISLIAGGVGPSSIARMLTGAASMTATDMLSQMGGQKTLSLAGVPLTDSELATGAVQSFLFGVAGMGLGEWLSGAAGRAEHNAKFSWMTDAKRAERVNADLPQPVTPTPETTPIPPGQPVAAQPAVSPPAKPSPEFAFEFNQTKALLDRILKENSATVSPASEVRLAKDLDHTQAQIDKWGVAPQDMTTPQAGLSETATAIPDVVVNQGVRAPELPPLWQRAARQTGVTMEDVARQGDPETWGKWDKVNSDLRSAQVDLDRATAFHEAAAKGQTTELDKQLGDLQEAMQRARTPAGQSRVANRMDEIMSYHQQVAGTRPGGTLPEPIKGMDRTALAQRVTDLTAKRDEIFSDVERSVSRAQGRWGLQAAERDALEEQLRPGANDRINAPFRYPKGFRRPKGAPKNPYEVELVKGPTLDEINAEKKLELPQQASPLAAEGAKAGETAGETATRVNDTETKTIAEETAPDYVKQLTDWFKTKEPEGPATGVAGAVKTAKTGQQLKPGGEVAIEPTLPSGMTATDLSKRGAVFELSDGKVGTIQDALKEIAGDEEAFTRFGQCLADTNA
jgi:hypothetical protein